MKKNARKESLGTRLKSYEKQFEARIPYDEYLICRIDGHKFSKFTKNMKKPFDEFFSRTMEETTKKLVEKFGAVTGYTQSDEITLVFAPSYKESLKAVDFDDLYIKGYNSDNEVDYKVVDKDNNLIGTLEMDYEFDENGYSTIDFLIYDEETLIDECEFQFRNDNARKALEKFLKKYTIKEVIIKNNQIFGGRIQKLTSLIASYTTLNFNNILKELVENQIGYSEYATDEERKYLYKMLEKSGKAWFDARVFGVPSKEEAFNAVMWRIRDAEKNSRSMFAQTFCSHKELLNKNGKEQTEYCFNKTGKDWNSIEDRYKYGILVKKTEYTKMVDLDEIQVFSDVSEVKRTKIVSWSEKLTKFSDESVNLIIRKLK